MKEVNKKAAEKYINAYKALIDAGQEITDEWFNHPNEFGEFKIGDIYFRESGKNDWPNNPKKWYFYIRDISFGQSGNNRRLYDLEIKFGSLEPEGHTYIGKYLYNLEEEGFKKINYLKGRLPYFDLETGFQIPSLSGSLARLTVSPNSWVVEGFLIDSPLVLVRFENERLYLLYPHEINKI